MLDLASTLRTGSNKACELLIGNRQLTGVRLLLPTRIAKKIEEPDLWIAEVRSDYEKAKGKTWLRKVDEVEQFIRGLCHQMEIDKSFGDYSFVATHDCPETQLSSASLEDVNKWACVLEACVAPGNPGGMLDPPGRITKRWEETIRQPIIPFDPTARRHELKHAYKALEQFVHCHEAMKRKHVLY